MTLKIEEVLGNYPKHWNGKPELLRKVIKVNDQIIQQMVVGKHKAASKAAVGSFIIVHVVAGTRFELPAKNFILPDEDEAVKACKILNRAHGYSDEEIEILNWLSSGNIIIDTAEGKRIFFPGQALCDN